MWLIRPRKEYLQLAGRAAWGLLGLAHCLELPLLRNGHAPWAPGRAGGYRHSWCPSFQKAWSSQAFLAREALGESPAQPGPSLNPHSRWRPERIPSSATLWLHPPKCNGPAPTPAPGLQGPLFSAVSSWGWGPRLGRSQGAAHREPGPGTWMTGSGAAEGPRPPKLLHSGCAKTP